MLTPSSHLALFDSSKDLVKSLRKRSLRIHAFQTIEEFESGSDGFDAFLIDLDFDHGRGQQLVTDLCHRNELASIVVAAESKDLHSVLVALELGALAVIEKPYDIDQVAKKIDLAVEETRHRRVVHRKQQELADRIRQLTDRQREVFSQLVAGKHVKEIALNLGIGIKTVHTFRSQLFEKVQIDSPIQLIREVAFVFGCQGLEQLSLKADDETISRLVHQVRRPL